jgi:hypothetical protein
LGEEEFHPSVDVERVGSQKDCDSKRSWIGGEGLPSRDLGQRKRERKCTTEGLVIMTMQVFWYRSHRSMGFNITVVR